MGCGFYPVIKSALCNKFNLVSRLKIQAQEVWNVQKLNSAGPAINHSRDVFTWATGTTSVAPKFSDALRSQISMLQDIRRQKLSKSGSKFRQGGGGYQKWSKKFRRLLWTAPNARRYSSVLGISTAKNEPFPHFLGFSEIFFPSNFRGVTGLAVHKLKPQCSKTSLQKNLQNIKPTSIV